jgi:hypothetical protein
MLFFFFIVLITTLLYAQQDSIIRPPVDVNFLFNYYEQDGDHSAVTGGEGTQRLIDRSSILVIKVPLDSFRSMHAHGGLNTYSSASTDRIDTRMSSASSKDSRARLYLGYMWSKKGKPWEMFAEGGASIESDYTSTSLQYRYARRSAKNDWEWSAGIHAFFDTWVVYVADEFRGTARASVPDDKRRSINLALAYSRVINRRMQGLISLEPSWQQGLLATPFHRVFVQNDPLAFVERLPANRWKLPLAARLNAFVGGSLVLRGSYRYYWDSFGIQAHTLSLKAPIKFGNFVSLAPGYRWHRQSAARYFLPKGQHLSSSPFFTSDFDLSAFTSHRLSGQLAIRPLYGVGRFKLFSKKKHSLDTISLSYHRFFRSDGLEAWWLGVDLGFVIYQNPLKNTER